MAKAESTERLIAENRKARYEYFIEDRFEAGLALQGWEVKAMRAGRAQIGESYAFLKDGEAFLSTMPAGREHRVRPSGSDTQKIVRDDSSEWIRAMVRMIIDQSNAALQLSSFSGGQGW